MSQVWRVETSTHNVSTVRKGNSTLCKLDRENSSWTFKAGSRQTGWETYCWGQVLVSVLVQLMWQVFLCIAEPDARSTSFNLNNIRYVKCMVVSGLAHRLILLCVIRSELQHIDAEINKMEKHLGILQHSSQRTEVRDVLSLSVYCVQSISPYRHQLSLKVKLVSWRKDWQTI